MSARSISRQALLVLAFGAAGSVLAADAEEPDMEFVEYLGLWEESDEEWLMVEHQLDAESEERIDPVPEGEESREDEHES
jgi:hypothetical protein